MSSIQLSELVKESIRKMIEQDLDTFDKRALHISTKPDRSHMIPTGMKNNHGEMIYIQIL